jgi:hypothetical protein
MVYSTYKVNTSVTIIQLSCIKQKQHICYHIIIQDATQGHLLAGTVQGPTMYKNFTI